MRDLDQLSLLVIYAAMASYTIALIAASIDISRLRARRDEAGNIVKKRQSASAKVGERASVRTPEAASVGASARSSGSATDLTGDEQAASDVSDSSSSEVSSSAEPSDAVERRRAAGIAVSTMWLGVAFHGIGVVLRAIAAGHVPWSNMYEFTITFTFVSVVMYLWLSFKRDLRDIGVFVLFPVVLLLGVAVAVLYVQADGLRPILDNYWLYLHVSIAIIAVAILGIAGVLATLQLAKDFSGGTGNFVERVLRGVPSAETLERVSYRITAVGFVLWTFTVIAGAIWAEHAWGRAWGWDAKEVWSFVIWVIYAAYLHARATRGWSGRRSAYLVITGFVAILLNYFVVNFLLSTFHGYAF